MKAAIKVVEAIGFYDSPPPNPCLDCTGDDDAGQGYERGWNAALEEVLGRLKASAKEEVPE